MCQRLPLARSLNRDKSCFVIDFLSFPGHIARRYPARTAAPISWTFAGFTRSTSSQEPISDIPRILDDVQIRGIDCPSDLSGTDAAPSALRVVALFFEWPAARLVLCDIGVEARSPDARLRPS